MQYPLKNDKTEELRLGQSKPKVEQRVMMNWSNIPVKVKSLGIYFGKDKKQVEDLN